MDRGGLKVDERGGVERGCLGLFREVVLGLFSMVSLMPFLCGNCEMK